MWSQSRRGSPGCVLIQPWSCSKESHECSGARPAAHGIEGLANGPGKLTLALGITRRHNGADFTNGLLTIQQPKSHEKFQIGVSPRIGIRHCADWPLRFFIRGNRVCESIMLS